MNRGRENRVLAIDPTSRGFGYVVMEGPEYLVDWGVQEGSKASNPWVVGHAEKLIERYAPDLLIVEDVDQQGARRRDRVRRLIKDLEQASAKLEVAAVHISRHRVRQMFLGAQAKNKEQIADAIAKHFAEKLGPYRPPIRKPWMSEDSRMAIFDAAAFALTYFYFNDDKPHAA